MSRIPAAVAGIAVVTTLAGCQWPWSPSPGNTGAGANPAPLATSGNVLYQAVAADAASLQGEVANPSDQSQVTDQPDQTSINATASKLLGDIPASQAKLYPDCADTAHYFGASLAYYLLAARTAQSGNYGAVLSDLRKGADALTWMKSEPNVQGALDFPGPNGNY